MDDNDVRDLFAGAKAEAGPPLGITAERIAARGVRVHRRRRQLAAMGGTVAVVAVAAVLTTTLTVRPPVTPAGPGSTSVPITHTVPKPTPTGHSITPPPATTTMITTATTTLATTSPTPTP